MNRFVKAVAISIVGTAIATVAIAGSHGNKAAEAAIKARKAQMQLYAFNLGGLGAMAKGQVEYNAETAGQMAASLKAVVGISSAAMWPQGSDSNAMPGMTRAKLEAWTTWPAIAEKQKDLAMAADELVKVAGNGQAALGGALQAVGMSCGGCHKPYREPK